MNTPSPAIDAQRIEYSYDTDKVLNGIDLSIQPGTIIGLLGKNGCGKTTLINCLLGFLKIQSGASSILGDDSWDLSGDVRQRLAFVPQSNDLFDWMTTHQLVNYVSKFYANWNANLVNELLLEWKVPMTGVVREFSVGEAQKLAIVLAMGHEPELLIMDEPVAALDPSAKRKFIRQLIELNSEKGNTVLFSTHITADVERVAADVAIIRDGKTYFQGPIDELKEKVVKLHVTGTKDLNPLGRLFGVAALAVTGQEAVLTMENYSDSIRIQIEEQFDATVTPQTLGLEDIFVELADG
ncbi:MAG: ABC transporter ATP-binding protein [Proteobacteria bacterium]|nr:ABC transporter ATP-binding protein [Pseudomonadota bacterium]